MKVLFAFSDTGAGHRSAALAIAAALNGAGASNTTHSILLDVLRTSDFPLVRRAPHIYDRLSTEWLPFYNLCFRLTDGPWQIDALTTIVNAWSLDTVAEQVVAINPDLVVCTHSLVQRMLCAVRRTYALPWPIITVVTDLVSLHQAWFSPEVDGYILPTDEAYTLARRRGIPPERMHRTGFPVHPRFAQSTLSQTEARRSLGIAEALGTVLVTAGGVGAGHLDSLVLELEKTCPDKQLLVVTGKNHVRYERLQAQKQHAQTHIYGFVENMDVLMAASDMVLTKAGPGTLMEALVMRRPVLLMGAVGLQERGNIDFVLNHRLGFFCPTLRHILEAVEALSDPQHYQATVARLTDAVPRDGAEQIARILQQDTG